MGAELCLAHDMGGWKHMGAPFGRHAALRLFHLILIYFLDIYVCIVMIFSMGCF